MMPTPRVVLVVLVASLAACGVHPPAPPAVDCLDEPCADAPDAEPATRAPGGVDVLFVIDNSGSMLEEQAALTAAFDGFVAALEAAHGGRPDLHIGVISSDLGAGGERINGCLEPDHGVLQHAPRVAGCTPPTDRYLVDADDGAGGRTANYEGSLGEAFRCIAELGTRGCGFEQHLEALRTALDPGTTANAGFLRDDAALAIVIVADEDDCSASNRALYDPNAPLGPLASFRCFEHGVVCTPDEPRTEGEKTGCEPRTDSPYLVDVAAIADEVRAVKPAGWVAVAAIVGAPAPVAVAPDPMTGYLELVPSCTGAAGTAVPALRLDAFARRFGSRHVVGDVCTGPAAALHALAQTIAEMIEEGP
jgi:hypothetical protein